MLCPRLVAIQNARLYREAQRRRDVASAGRVSRELTGTLEPSASPRWSPAASSTCWACRLGVFHYEPETHAARDRLGRRLAFLCGHRC